MEQEYSNILVGIDGSPQANYAYECAIEIARRNHAKIYAVTILQNSTYDLVGFGQVSESANEHLIQEFTRLHAEIIDWAHGIDFHDVESKIIHGNTRELMTHLLPEKYSIDLIVVGQSGLNGFERFFIGSIADYIIRKAPCDVMVIGPQK
ncbi:MAG: universal stress protein [Streptococcaceae bacterium]|jgi:nucleotide-binding universal stress UspA family protein|nr:universal stress protein [Streptococcaceae bacterium]